MTSSTRSHPTKLRRLAVVVLTTIAAVLAGLAATNAPVASAKTLAATDKDTATFADWQQACIGDIGDNRKKAHALGTVIPFGDDKVAICGEAVKKYPWSGATIKRFTCPASHKAYAGSFLRALKSNASQDAVQYTNENYSLYQKGASDSRANGATGEVTKNIKVTSGDEVSIAMDDNNTWATTFLQSWIVCENAAPRFLGDPDVSLEKQSSRTAELETLLVAFAGEDLQKNSKVKVEIGTSKSNLQQLPDSKVVLPDLAGGVAEAHAVGKLEDLKPNTTYYYRVTLSNQRNNRVRAGYFTTLPLASTAKATPESLATTRATVGGQVKLGQIGTRLGYTADNMNVFRARANYQIEYGPTNDTEITHKTRQVGFTRLDGTTDDRKIIPTELKHLEQGQEYQWRIVVLERDRVISEGDWNTFKTLKPAEPSTGAVTNITPNSAAITGTVKPNGHRELDWAFEWRRADSGSKWKLMKSQTLDNSVDAEVALGKVTLADLDPAASYEARLVVREGDDQRREGKTVTFTTSALPAEALAENMLSQTPEQAIIETEQIIESPLVALATAVIPINNNIRITNLQRAQVALQCETTAQAGCQGTVELWIPKAAVKTSGYTSKRSSSYKLVGKANFAHQSEGVHKLNVPLSKLAQRELRKHKRLTMQIAITTKGQNGKLHTKTHTGIFIKSSSL